MTAMRSRICGALALAAIALGAASFASVPARAEIDPKSITIVPFDKLNFPGDPSKPQIATVFGDSTKPGLYGIVIKWPPHANSRPHSHPNDRYITVLSGTWWINTGAKFNPDGMIPMKPGSFIIHHAGEIHYDGTKDEPAMIYIVGMGPAPSIDREDPSTKPKK
jgi:quercetin dioxygenase-like cupin family protein